MGGYTSDRAKLDRISEVVGEIFGKIPMSGPAYPDLLLIDSICDVPLESEI